jgi:hypothetical protein
MTASNRLGLRIKPNDEEVLFKLAEYLDRNISDTVRFAVKETARRYGLLPKKKPWVVTKFKEEKERSADQPATNEMQIPPSLP